jgi:cytochrome P450
MIQTDVSGPVTCSRTVTGKAFSFSDGLTLPVGTRFGFPIKAMQSDSDNFKCPEEFDGYRFMKTPQEDTAIGGLSSEDTHRSSATAMSATNLAWGYGTHVCPGRFFAVRCIKIILTKLLLEFDVEWERNRGDKRPECIHVEGQFVPNRTQKIILTPRGRA